MNPSVCTSVSRLEVGRQWVWVAICIGEARGVGGDVGGGATIQYGEPFQAWEMWPSPHSEKPVGREVSGQDPHPRIGSPVGNEALIVPRPL